MVPGLALGKELSVSNGRQFIPFAGIAELESGDLMGSASAPVSRVLVTTLHDHHAAPESPLEVPGPLLDGDFPADVDLGGLIQQAREIDYHCAQERRLFQLHE